MRILTEISAELSAEIEINSKMTDFIYNLEEGEYHSLIIENFADEVDLLKVVRIANNIRPRIPQIIISDDEDKHLMSMIHQEGIFYNCVPPINKDRLKKIIQSSFEFFRKKNEIISNLNKSNSISYHKE